MRSPCHCTVQPPACIGMSSAPRPATWMRFSVFWSGNARLSFFSSTSDSRTARRATARCSAEPKLAARAGSDAAEAPGFKPIANLTRRMRRTASSTRACGTSPASTRLLSVAMNSWYFCGTITMSMPALIDVLTSLL